MGAKHAPLEERFWRYVDKTETCWLWTGSVDTSGYGQIRDGNGRLVRATRVSCMLAGKIIPEGEQACHSCDVLWPDKTYRRCVRPDHLWPGSALANTRDAIEKGRFPFAADNPVWHAGRPRGEAHQRAKLTDDIVRQIRLDYAPASSAPGQHPTSLRGLARKYGVAKGVIQGIVECKTWRHVT